MLSPKCTKRVLTAYGQEQDELDVVERHRQYIVNRILTLACPRCSQAFVDFTGCFALTCASQRCGATFCAYCLLDCGSDAHAHVESCAYNKGRGDLYGRFEEFVEHQKQRKARKVEAYLTDLSATMPKEIIDQIRAAVAGNV